MYMYLYYNRENLDEILYIMFNVAKSHYIKKNNEYFTCESINLHLLKRMGTFRVKYR